MDQKINKYITDDDVKIILYKCKYSSDATLESYDIHNASTHMMGYLSDYWRLKIHIATKNKENRTETLNFFIKAVSKSNASKAKLVRELKLFEKELGFYEVIKKNITTPNIKPWSAKLISPLNEAMVFEDLTALQYKTRNKLTRFDKEHTLQALKTLARFHASSIIFEENKKQILKGPYTINDEYSHLLNEGGYHKSDIWFLQCMNGALEAILSYSKYSKNDKIVNIIKTHWCDVWFSALELSNMSPKYRNVVCHRDLWNNNILFHYKKVGDDLEPDDCVFVDFQAVRYQPPAGDVMLLLCCNLDPKFREENLNTFLDYYYKELKLNLSDHDIQVEDIMKRTDFFNLAEHQRKWGLVVYGCLLPQFWLDDELTTKIFCDTTQFHNVLSNNKGGFIKDMMEVNRNYRDTVIEIFDEIIERYIIKTIF
ncbi:uncharacterized protein ACR2FA_000710 [Aphomia sociella]